MADILVETQLERDQELSRYTGRSLEAIQALQIGSPASIRIHPEHEIEVADSLDHLYEDFKHLDVPHYLRTLAHYTVTRRGAYIKQVEGQTALEGLKVLDFGCGVGSHGIYCAQHGARVHLLDVDGPLYQYAQWRAAQRGLHMRFLPVDAKLKPENYDVVLCLDVLEHMAHPVEALERITATLKPGGLLFLEASLMIKPTSGHFTMSVRRWQQGGPKYLRRYYSPRGGKMFQKSMKG